MLIILEDYSTVTHTYCDIIRLLFRLYIETFLLKKYLYFFVKIVEHIYVHVYVHNYHDKFSRTLHIVRENL